MNEETKEALRELRMKVSRRADECNRLHCNYCEGKKFAYLGVVEEIGRMLGEEGIEE